jgi:two-component system NtrC family sensor kinase
MNRRFLLNLLCAAAVAWPLAADAQQPNDQVLGLHGRILRLQAEGLSEKITRFVKEVESQLGWMTQLPWSAGTVEQRRFDALRLLRQVPAITEMAQLDAAGKEQIKVSRLAMDVIGSGADFSSEPKFTETLTKKVYYGPVYFRQGAGTWGTPYMTLSLAGMRRDAGVSIAEVNLALVQDALSTTKVGDQGVAYIVDDQGRVIAHPDKSVIQRDFSGLAHVQEARTAGSGAEPARIARDVNGREVLAAYARVVAPGWLVFVELPIEEAKPSPQ